MSHETWHGIIGLLRIRIHPNTNTPDLEDTWMGRTYGPPSVPSALCSLHLRPKILNFLRVVIKVGLPTNGTASQKYEKINRNAVSNTGQIIVCL